MQLQQGEVCNSETSAYGLIDAPYLTKRNGSFTIRCSRKGSFTILRNWFTPFFTEQRRGRFPTSQLHETHVGHRGTKCTHRTSSCDHLGNARRLCAELHPRCAKGKATERFYTNYLSQTAACFGAFSHSKGLGAVPNKVPVRFPQGFEDSPTRFPHKVPTHKLPTRFPRVPNKVPTRFPNKVDTRFPQESPTNSTRFQRRPQSSPTRFNKPPTRFPTRFSNKVPTRAGLLSSTIVKP